MNATLAILILAGIGLVAVLIRHLTPSGGWRATRAAGAHGRSPAWWAFSACFVAIGIPAGIANGKPGISVVCALVLLLDVFMYAKAHREGGV